MELDTPLVPSTNPLGYGGFGTRLRTLRKGANGRQTDEMKSAEMSFTICQEISADGRAGRRNVVAGEGMLAVKELHVERGPLQGRRHQANQPESTASM
jgi:hypothetical protein